MSWQNLMVTKPGQKKYFEWGFTDTQFKFIDDKNLILTGDRYHLAGKVLPDMIPFCEEIFGGIKINSSESEIRVEELNIPKPILNHNMLTDLEKKLSEDQMIGDDKVRLSHSHGYCAPDEIYKIFHGKIYELRVVDLVVYPQSEEDILQVVKLANKHNVCIVPYGGGTNVSKALACPLEEKRMIVSLDMTRMNKIVWIDQENSMACVEAGVKGLELENLLTEKGYTLGHQPDSIEFSTLGGWISTNASGMKRNKYGNIEDIVIEATFITPTGNIENRIVTPRNSLGVLAKNFLFGSEGNFGVITKAIVKINKLPTHNDFGAYLFPNFEIGVQFLKEVYQAGKLPVSIRLVNNTEFRMGLSLKPRTTFTKTIIDKLKFFMIYKLFKFNQEQMVACTLGFEGEKEEINLQKNIIKRVAKKFGGLNAGAENSRRGYMLTFAIAYIGDFFRKYFIIGETMETSVPWSKIHLVTMAVKNELNELVKKYNVPGRPYCSFRITQLYQTGVCIYFTVAIYNKGLKEPDKIYKKIEHRLREVILENGGSLSHHHGVGKIRKDFLQKVFTPNYFTLMKSIKKTLDPNNIFSIGNGAFGNVDDV